MTEQSAALLPLELLASSLAGRPLQLKFAPPGERSWTDGKCVFIDATHCEHEQLEAIVVQACLLSAGSLAPPLLRELKRSSKLAARYLAVEGQRALCAHEALLPTSMIERVDRALASRADSAQSSLLIARSREPLAPAPAAFGELRASALLAASPAGSADADSRIHTPRRQRDALAELADEDELHDSAAATDMFSVGGAEGLLGRWLKRLLQAGRSSASGSPGGDAGSHRARGLASRRKSLRSTASLAELDGDPSRGSKTMYPEWDMRERRYRPNWCTVLEVEPALTASEPPSPSTGRLRRPLARVGLGFKRYHRQPHGDDIDIDAAIASRVELLSGSTPDENVYVQSMRRRRDLSVLILLDISASASEPGARGTSVHEQQREAAADLISTLHELGDRVALYAYNSQGRSAVTLVPVKRFADRFGAGTMRRLWSLTPGAYSRLGAAMRHGASVLEEQGGTRRRLLLVLSDGLAYDHGYEKDYGAADARRALSEARRRGTGCLCLTFGSTTDAESLRRIFGSAAHATIQPPSQLADAVGALIGPALRAAEVRRQLA